VALWTGVDENSRAIRTPILNNTIKNIRTRTPFCKLALVISYEFVYLYSLKTIYGKNMTIDQIIAVLVFGCFWLIPIIFVCSGKDEDEEQRQIHTQQTVPMITTVEEFAQPPTEHDSFLELPPI